MNLVKAQEYAQALPLAELQKYANGLDPDMLPAWLATAEIQAKEKRSQMANNLRGAAQGPQPSIKEQIEQKAGLMAAQQPGMTPGAPQMQPQAPPTMMAAHGGLTRLPSHFNFDGGGIVAFATGDKVKEPEESLSERYGAIPKLAAEFGVPIWMYRQAAEVASQTGTTVGQILKTMLGDAAGSAANVAKVAGTAPGLAVLAGGIPATQFANDVMANNPKLQEAYADMGAMGGAMDPEGAMAAAMYQQAAANKTKATPTIPEDLGREGTRVGRGIDSSPNLVLGSGKPPGAPRPPGLPGAAKPPVAGSPPAAPAGPPPDSAQAMAMQALKEQAIPMTQDAAIAERRAGEKAFGLDKPAGEDQMARIDALNKKYESSKPTGLQELIQMLGQSSQYKGMSGMAPAYTAMEAQKRAADLAHAKEINTLMSGVEGTRRGESTAGLTGAGTTLEKNREQTNTLNKERMQSLAAMAGNETHERSSRYTADMHYKAAMAQAANADRRQDAAEKRAVMDSFKVRLAAIDRELVPLEKSMMQKDKDLAAGYRAEKAGLTKALDEASGIATMVPAPSATRPSGTKPPLSSFQR